ncbi:peptidoglycan DD-metalloendopeptidase family protein [Streptomyces sp. NPDC059985]|uniref:peptidoglycan DD-metalloendopeptidase family protein n=1 Tax=Streptomyces sp. NPDC059985 TaxID=3347025 RepID=UPI0036BB50DD
MPDLDIVGTVAVDVVPLVPNFNNRLKALVLPIADKVGKEAGERMGKAISDNIVIAIPEAIIKGGMAGVRAAGKQGDDAGGAFARSLRTKLQAAFKAMPKLNIGLDDTGVNVELARIRAKLEQLSNKRIGIDISAERATAQITHLEEKLRELGAAHPNVAVRADTATARAALAAVRAEIEAVGGRRTIALEVDGTLGAKMRAVVEQAQASLPEINVDADTSPARAEIQSLRAQLTALADQRIGIDIDAATALAQINAVQERLRILSFTAADIDVRADTAAAAAQLAALQAMADDTKIFRIEALADTSQATNALIHLIVQFGILLALPAAPPILAGLGGIAAMATAGAAGLGALALVAVPAIKGVTSALQAKKAADEDATKASDNGAKSAAQSAQRALQMAGAQDALSAAHRNAARSIAQANRGVEDAERAVAQASQRASDDRIRAAEAVENAEESLTRAKEDAKRAEEDLTEARAEAARQLRDLNDRLADGALDQRAAALRVKKAEDALTETRAKGSKATALELEEVLLKYDQAVQSAKEQKTEYADLQVEAAKARKAGIAGNDAVISATERVADAQRSVRDQTKGVADAQTAAARQQIESAQSVADAQRRVADATEAAAHAQITAAESIESAERGVQSARLSGIGALVQAKTKTDEYAEALAKLSPEQRQLFDSIAGPSGLTSAFKAWHKELQPAVLPLFTRAVDGMKGALPGLTPLVLSAASAVNTLMDKASAQLKNPFWVGFKQDIKESAEPAIIGLGTAFGNILKGMAGVIDAFLPHMDGIVATSDRITGRFANWGTSLKGSPDFERFLKYVKDTSPGLASFLGDIFRAALDVAQSLSPLSQVMFTALAPIIDTVSWIATNAPEFVVALWGIYFATKAITVGMAAFALAMVVYEAVMIAGAIATSGFAFALGATGIVPIIRAVVIIIGLLAAAVVWAYNNVDWFRTAVDTAWAGIKIATEFLWREILKPALDGIWWALKGLGEIAMWLWEKAIQPAFSFIWDAARMLFQILAVVVLVPLYLLFKALGKIGMWLWEEALGPIFGWIGDKAVSLWNNYVKPSFNMISDKFAEIGKRAKELWNEYVKPVFQWIADKAMWLYKEQLKPSMDRLGELLSWVGDRFEGTKNNIKKSWDQLKEITKGPVSFIIETVYNGGIVPVWNAVAKITGVGEIKPVKGFHTGGIMSGYSPGRDDRMIAVGGGEAIMRPEWTRAVGADRINSWNAAARSGGISGVQRAISSGMPAYKDGGIIDWVKGKAGRIGDVLKGGWDALTDPGALFDELMSGAKSKMRGIADDNRWAEMATRIPAEMIGDLKDKALEFFGFGGDGGVWSKPVNAAYGTKFGVAGGMWASGRHTGLDFPAGIGEIVRAVAGGKVTMATGGGPYGNHIMVNHGGGLSSLYAHLSEIATSVGQVVSAGQTIGRVGDTGNTSGPHLHLEARVNGRSVDPMTYLSGGGGGNGGSDVARWRGVVNQALALTGNPLGYADTTLRRLSQESGGNPRAVNNWDINARNGTPSVGLMQVIKPTFDAYAGMMRGVGPKLYGVSVDPLANIYSSMQYAMSRYGSLPRAYNRPGGYANGGFPGIGELAWVGEQGPELVRFLSPTQVYSHSDSMAMTRQASGLKGLVPAGGRAPNVTVENRVFVGDREITDIVRHEVVVHTDGMADALNTGRRY